MKFSLIVILGLCAVAANTQQFEYTALEAAIPQGEVLDNIKDLLEKVKQYAQEAIQNILSKLKELAEKIKNGINPKIAEAVRKVIDFVKRIADLANTGIVAKVCVNLHKDRLEDIVNRLNAGVAECQAIAMKELEVIQAEVMETVGEIQGYAQDLYNVINECLDEENILAKVWCMVKKIFYIRDQIKAAYESIEATINSAQEKIPVIVEEAQQCTLAAQQEVMPELTEIMQKVQQCIAENRY
ncbi:uncharacterized protein LOC129612048 [Condylostylus longicornis]|uniref:uncharacterized protein LOC129612048 n=1 Tax=Condylostylus longicornis TaxID=2530218 RepID=UPI00244E19B9|nr:uncharacterized protein LOC129612048 [Condylostylus longicornis]